MAKSISDLGLRLLSEANVLRKIYGRSGEYEMRLVNDYVKPNSVALDVGANKGVYARIMSAKASRVIAFEPLPELHHWLAAVLPSNCELVRAAVGAKPGTATIRVPRRGGAAELAQASLADRFDTTSEVATVHEVDVVTIDQYADLPISFIKIDVEGFEPEVLAGAQETLARHQPNLLIELEERHRPGVIDQVASTLGSRGYEGFFFFEKRRLPIELFRVSEHQNLAHFREGAPRSTQPYVNNFLFTPSRG